MSMAANDPKAIFRNLRYNNIVFVEPDNGLPDWAGIIWPRTYSENGVLKFTLMSAEWMLGQRQSDNNDKCLGNTAQVFLYMLHLAKRYYPLPISNKNVISEPGDDADRVLNAELILDAINKLAEETDNFWWLEPSRRNDGNLEFIPHLEKKVGRNLFRPLAEGVDIGDVKITEEPPDLANIIYAFGRFPDWRDPVDYTVQNATSVGLFGAIQSPFSILDVEEEAGLIAPAKAALRRRGLPYLSVTCTFIGSGNLPRPGDRVPFNFSAQHGFFVERRGINVKMTVTSLQVDPAGGKIVLTATEFVE